MQKFYLQGRTKVSFPHHTSPNYESLKTLDEWTKVKSTKVEALISLLTWHLTSDDHQQIKAGEESAFLANSSSCGAEKAPDDLMTMGARKILVYMEFPMMAPLLVSVSYFARVSFV